MQPPENAPSNSLAFVPNPSGAMDNPLSAAAMDKRLAMLEHMMADSINRLDRVQHLVELLLNEAHARRRADGAPADGKTHWSDAGFPIIPRNLPVDFGTLRDNEAVNPDDFLASGWYAREAWGVWGRDSVQALRFALEEYRGGYATVNLALQCFVAPGIDHHSVDILANGYFLGSHKLGAAAQRVSLRLPPSCVGDGNILLQIQHDAPQSPAAADVSADTRILGVGLVSLDAG